MIASLDSYTRVRDQSADELALAHAPLVRRIASHLLCRLPPGVPLDDLVQSGMLMLLEAARSYDASRDASFETYAGIRVRGAMLDEIRANAWAPRSAHRRAREISAAMNALRHELGREASGREVAEHIGISLDEYHEALDAVSRGRLLSLDDLGEDDRGVERLTDEATERPDDAVQRTELAALLAGAIDQLSERERLVVALYYQDELNFKEIGAVLGVSESRVCQIHGQVLSRLRGRMSEWRGGD